MKKLLLLAALFLGTMGAAADDSNYISGTMSVNGTYDVATLHVNLTNAKSYVAFQMDIAFDDVTLTSTSAGITFNGDRDNKGTVTISGASQSTSFVVASAVVNNKLRIVAYNLGNIAIAGDAGDEVLKITITSTAKTKASDWKATFSNVLFVNSDLAEEELNIQKNSDDDTATDVDNQAISGVDDYSIYDVNRNGEVTVLDLQLWIKYYSSLDDEEEEEEEESVTIDSKYDFTNDGKVTLLDLQAWLKYYNSLDDEEEEEEEE